MKFDDAAIQRITKGLLQPIDNRVELLKVIGTKLQQNTDVTFRLLGARDGHAKWLDYNKGEGHIPGGTTMNKRGEFKGTKAKGIWKRRGGTDNAKGRKYSFNSKMLQASGGFRKSFGLIQTTDDKLTYGVQPDWQDLAGKIISGHGAVREVLFVTENEYDGYKKLAVAWFANKIKI
jgi:hypothetical protein